MASAHDRAVLQAIFSPTSPLGDVPGPNQEEELIDDGKCELLTWCVYTYHVTAFYVYHFIAYWIYLNTFDSVTRKKPWHFNPSWVLGDVSVFSLPRCLSIEFECFFNLFISLCQTVALTQSCWSKWKSWRCGVSLLQRLGICKLHFKSSARQSRSCLSEPQPTTTGPRPCGCWGTQQVHATHSIITLSSVTAVHRHTTLLSLRIAWHHFRAVSIWCTFSTVLLQRPWVFLVLCYFLHAFCNII